MNQTKTVFATKTSTGYTEVIDVIVPETGKGQWSGESLEEVRKRYPNIACMDLDEVLLLQESSHRTSPSMILKRIWIDALEALPPERWVKTGHSESFVFSERLSGRMTTIYVRVYETYWSFVDRDDLPHNHYVERVRTESRLRMPV